MSDEAQFNAATEQPAETEEAAFAGHADAPVVSADSVPDPSTGEVPEKGTDVVVSDTAPNIRESDNKDVNADSVDNVLAEIHDLVKATHEEIASLKAVVVELRPHIEALMADVREKGLAGIIPAMIQAFKG